MTRLTGLAATLLAVLVPPLDRAHAAPTVEAIEQRIADRLNGYRKDQGLKPLDADERLHGAATSFARFMARTGKYGHRADGRTPAERAGRAGYEHCIVRENIAMLMLPGEPSARDLAGRFMTGWIESKGHRENLQARHVTEYGIGVARAAGKEGAARYYAVQLFAKPRDEIMRFTVRNTRKQSVTYTVDGTSFTLQPNAARTHAQCTPPVVKTGAAGKTRTIRPRSGKTIDL